MKLSQFDYACPRIDISGTPADIMKGMALVADNDRKMKGCPGHDFEPITGTPVIASATMECVHCGGEVTTIITERPQPADDEIPPELRF